MSDILFYNGKIHTLDNACPCVESILVQGKKITAVGKLSEVKKSASIATASYDLCGKVLLPGFHDSHAHIGETGFSLQQIQLENSPSLEDALSRIEHIATTVAPGTWIKGAGFLSQRWGCPELSSEMLDQVTEKHPIAIYSQDRHSMWVNSLALRLAGISSLTQDPPEGRIVRDKGGKPRGILLERAQDLVINSFAKESEQDLILALQNSADYFARNGITTVHQMGFESTESWRVLSCLASRRDFPLRVWSCVMAQHIDALLAIGLTTGLGSDNFQIGGVKFVADGALGSLTAHMLEAYGSQDNYGQALCSESVLTVDYARISAKGLVPVTHAIGDAANRTVLNALEKTKHIWGIQGIRPRIEHVQHIKKTDLLRLAGLGVVASMQPIHFAFDVPRICELLPERTDECHNWRSVIDSGAVLAFGSDSPVAPVNPLAGIKAAATRQGEKGYSCSPQEKITVREALHAYTTGASQAISWEHRSGRIKLGYDADLVILSGDPLDSDPVLDRAQLLDSIEVEATMKGGVWTYQRC